MRPWIAWWCLLLLSFSAQAGIAQPTCQQATEIGQAERTVLRAGQVLDRATVTPEDALALAWRRQGTQIRYRIQLDACPAGADWGLWVFRMGGPYRAWIDGKPVQPIDPVTLVGSQVYNGRIPALFQLPQGARELVIEIVDLVYMGSGLIRVSVGPQVAMLESRALSQLVITDFNSFSSTMIGMAGLLAMLVWFYRRQDRAALWFAVACLAWVVRGVTYQFFAYPFAPLVVEQLNPWLVLVTSCSLAASWLHGFQGTTVRRLRTIAALCLAISLAFVVTLVLEQGAQLVRALAFASGFAVLFAVLVFLLQRWRQGSLSPGLLALGLGALLAGSVHDMGMVIGYASPANWAFLNVGFTLLLLSHVVVVSIFQVKQLNRAEHTNAELERNIQAKALELEQSYAMLRASERASARAQERAWLNREIHDGVGAQLITALRGVERGTLSKERVAQTLQEGLDELRLLMDAGDLGQSLHRALATWRNRWDSRLEAIGLNLRWEVGRDLEQLELGSNATLQVMRVLQEAVTNTVKHAEAQHITVRAWLEGSPHRALVLEVRDDGRGLVAVRPASGGRGLRHMVQRAETLGGTLSVDNAASGGVRVLLSLPLSGSTCEASNTTPLMP
ncbi:MAG: 7TM diverse intracellular signaling domain-containing protein [Hydrogenophaga sp.]|nr:7TM diverse intracellular signaling domain-containing protein [Hydrogenophaga sp.]